MSYIALYRKFRPDTFDEVKGQDHIVTTLRNQMRSDRVGHAYLFCGTRGTGKTTMAKLLAKAVNCDNLQDGNPCCECESCKAIASGNAMNVIEIDAASNSGVDNMRQIKEAVQYAPSQGKKLVYIIDEAHMLTREAFNALLKTLEEPPEYCLFILATTEDHKIPITIKSRCQKYDFHRISVETIFGRLKDLTEREGVDAEDDALQFIARAGDGSMRDALSILDECIASRYNEKLTYDSVLETVGAVDIEVYINLTEAIHNSAADEVLNLINSAVWQGKDMVKYVDDYVWFMRNLLFIKLSPDSTSGMDLTRENIERIIKLSENYTREELTRYLTILQELSQAVRLSNIKRVTIEMSLIKMMHPETDKDYDALASRLDKLEQGITPGASGASSARIEELEGIMDEKIDSAVRTLERKIEGMKVVAPASSMSDEEISDNVKSLLKDRFEAAQYEEVLNFARLWKSDYYAKLNPISQRYLKGVDLEAGKEFTDSGELAVLNIIIPNRDRDGKENMGYIYYLGKDNAKREQNQLDLMDELASIAGRRIKLNFREKNASVGAAYSTEEAFLNRIDFEDTVIKQ